MLLVHPRRPWIVDGTLARVRPDALDALPWARVFAEMEALEAGAVANPDEGRRVGHYWLRAPELAPTMGEARVIGETIEAVRAFADAVRQGSERAPDLEPFTDVIHVGIGGSALGPALLVDALAAPEADRGRPGDDRGLRFHLVDNVDPDGVARVLAGVGERLRHTLVVVVSKSGGTVETAAGLELVKHAMVRRGLDPGGHLVAVTQAGSALEQRARSERWRRTFPLWDWVGGRTSVTSAVGLLPAGLVGVDTSALLAGAAEMDVWTRTPDWRDNPSALLAGLWHALGGGRGARAMVVLPYQDRLLLLARYLQQLVMESIGKQHDRGGAVVAQGLTVYGNKGSTDQHAFVQQLRDGTDDTFVTFVQVLDDGAGSSRPTVDGASAGDLLQGFLLGTRRALAEGGRPSITLTVPTVDARVLGGMIAMFERAVGLYASLIDVNAYHQPGVEAGKKAAAATLTLQKRLVALLPVLPTTAEALAARLEADPVEVFYLLERLAQTGRARRDASTTPPKYGQPR
jgi:glucose-6-phosphate isomerase